jgi:hypothetical protein
VSFFGILFFIIAYFFVCSTCTTTLTHRRWPQYYRLLYAEVQATFRKEYGSFCVNLPNPDFHGNDTADLDIDNGSDGDQRRDDSEHDSTIIE